MYLHTGTREGARLFGLAGRDRLLPSELPRIFRRLTLKGLSPREHARRAMQTAADSPS